MGVRLTTKRTDDNLSGFPHIIVTSSFISDFPILLYILCGGRKIIYAKSHSVCCACVVVLHSFRFIIAASHSDDVGDNR